MAGRSSAWPAFVKAYRASHPGATMKQCSAAYRGGEGAKPLDYEHHNREMQMRFNQPRAEHKQRTELPTDEDDSPQFLEIAYWEEFMKLYNITTKALNGNYTNLKDAVQALNARVDALEDRLSQPSILSASAPRRFMP